MTPKEINEMSYTDFVGYINQWNVLPGAYDTLNRWRIYASVTPTSDVLEIACTTGFSSREMARMTGCSCHGIDISAKSVASAQKNKEQYASDAQVTYEVADAVTYQPDKKYTHVMVGASVKFFGQQQSALLRTIQHVLQPDGYLLASPFYVTSEIPSALIEQAREVFGITITTESYKDIMWAYKDFEIVYEEHKTIIPETDRELEHYCTSTINLFKVAHPELTPETYDAMYKRLLAIKQMSNVLRPYQAYVVLVLRARSGLFGKRLVELF